MYTLHVFVSEKKDFISIAYKYVVQFTGSQRSSVLNCCSTHSVCLGGTQCLTYHGLETGFVIFRILTQINNKVILFSHS